MKNAAGRFRRAVLRPASLRILKALERHTPRWVICLEVRILCGTTARGFGVPAKRIRAWSAEKALSRIYTPEECALMSNVDSGMIAGILGGGSLTFSERITEGCGGCRARLS